MTQQELRRFLAHLITEEEKHRQVAAAVQPHCQGLSLPCTQWANAVAAAETLHNVVVMLGAYVQGGSRP